MLGKKHHLEVYEKRSLETAEKAQETSAHSQQRAARLKFAKQYKNLTVEEWDDFLFWDECPKYLFQLPNPKDDIVWGSQVSHVPPAYQVKNSSKWIILGGMTGRGLTGIHFLPQGQTLTADYYINNILEKEVKPVLHRKNVNEATDKRKLFVCSAPFAT